MKQKERKYFKRLLKELGIYSAWLNQAEKPFDIIYTRFDSMLITMLITFSNTSSGCNSCFFDLISSHDSIRTPAQILRSKAIIKRLKEIVHKSTSR